MTRNLPAFNATIFSGLTFAIVISNSAVAHPGHTSVLWHSHDSQLLTVSLMSVLPLALIGLYQWNKKRVKSIRVVARKNNKK